MLRKFFVASTALLFRDNPTFQLSIALMGMFFVFVVQIIYRPYWSVEEQDAFAAALYKEKHKFDAQVKAMENSRKTQYKMARRQKTVAGKPKSARVADYDPNGRKDSEMDEIHHEERSKAMNRSKNILFNLNTIESIMLVSVILVNLSGIMLLSGQFENLEDDDYTARIQRDMVTYSIIVVISGSFIMLFASLFREIRLARTIKKNMAGAKWRAAIRKQIAINKRKRASVKKFQDAVYAMMRKHKIGLHGQFESEIVLEPKVAANLSTVLEVLPDTSFSNPPLKRSKSRASKVGLDRSISSLKLDGNDKVDMLRDVSHSPVQRMDDDDDLVLFT
jgi:hypothetical protein